MQTFNLDELLDQIEPIASVKIGGVDYQFWSPQHISEGDRLRFIDAQERLYDLAMKLQLKNKEVQQKMTSKPKKSKGAEEDFDLSDETQDDVIKLFFAQKKTDVESIAPSRDYLEALAQLPKGGFSQLKPVQINKLIALIQPLAVAAENAKSEESETTETEGNGNSETPESKPTESK